MSRKLVGLFLTVILALVALAGRITYINATKGQAYARQVLTQTQQSYESRVIPFRRGDILDRNGTILATNEKVYNVILDCSVVNSKTEDTDGNKVKAYYEPTVKALHEIFGIDEDEIRKRLDSDDTKDSQYQVIKKEISISDKKAFESYTDTDSAEYKKLSDSEKSERRHVRGVWFEEHYKRIYPLNSLACDTIGFTYSDNSADWGIEGYYSSVLEGVNGRQYGYYTNDADSEQTIIPATDGKNVVSTIDVGVQRIIRSALEDYEKEMGGSTNGSKGAKNVAVVVMNPNNGEILGMDSSKWYDLNNPRDLDPFYTEEEQEAMSEEDMLDALNDIWKNYAVTDAYEPGSTFKPITAAAALETGAITPETIFVCNGYQQVYDSKIKCDGVHGAQNLQQALQHSCNDALMQIGAATGGTSFLKYQSIFNFGKKTGIDLPGEGTGTLYNSDSLGPVELATNSFGQGFTCTMIQEAAAFSSIINGGYYYKPHVVSTITDSDGSVVKSFNSTLEKRVISSEVSDIIREDLGTVVQSGGTGRKAKVAGYTMGGKTGTAEKLPRGNGKYLVSFIGFAPLDNPQVVVYAVVDEPNAERQDSNTYAVNVAHNVMEKLFPYLNIYPDEEGAQSVSVDDEDYSVDASAEEGTNDTEIANPPTEDETQSGEDTEEEENDNLFSDGMTNEEQAITQNAGE